MLENSTIIIIIIIIIIISLLRTQCQTHVLT